MELTPQRGRAAALLIAGVLIFCDVAALALAGFTATIAILIAIGFVEGRLRAVAWAVILVASAFVADFLWQLDWEPFNRSDDYEAIPQTPYVFVALPVPMAIIAVGVGAGALCRRIPITAPRLLSCQHRADVPATRRARAQRSSPYARSDG